MAKALAERIHDLWPIPQDGLDPYDDAPYTWDLEDFWRDGRTTNPPDRKGKWYRWYFIYHKPICTRIKISADQDPETGKWFKPHPSSGQDEIKLMTHLKTPSRRGSPDRRIMQFYRLFNAKKWKDCFNRVDPMLRDGHVDFQTYAKSLDAFFAKYGPIEMGTLSLTLFENVKNKLYDDRDFACGILEWQDRKGQSHQFKERWVKSGDHWYTRKVGLV